LEKVLDGDRILFDILNIADDDDNIRVYKKKYDDIYYFRCVESTVENGRYLIDVCNNISDRLSNEDIDHTVKVFVNRMTKLKFWDKTGYMWDVFKDQYEVLSFIYNLSEYDYNDKKHLKDIITEVKIVIH
jgi:hypothetical protein